jgi:hypothetical protein
VGGGKREGKGDEDVWSMGYAHMKRS